MSTVALISTEAKAAEAAAAAARGRRELDRCQYSAAHDWYQRALLLYKQVHGNSSNQGAIDALEALCEIYWYKADKRDYRWYCELCFAAKNARNAENAVR